MDRSTVWAPRNSPYDPRYVDGAMVIQDEQGRLIERADCSRRCPGCGICCEGYRDVIQDGYRGLEEFAGNLMAGPDGLVELEGGRLYRPAACGPACPGYGDCCAPVEQRRRPETVDEARHILLECADSRRWEMQEALLILAHAGTAEAVAVLEAFAPRAHAKVAGFAQCALEEGTYFASLPGNEAEARTMMKRAVLQAWEDRATCAQGAIWEELEPRLERLRYEYEIIQRLLNKGTEEDREEWADYASVLHDIIGLTEAELEEQQAELVSCAAMIAEIEADLLADQEAVEGATP